MNSNTLAAFTEFIIKNQKFIAYESKELEIPDGGISEEEFESQAKVVRKITSGEKHNYGFNTDLEDFKNLAILYIQSKFAEYKENAAFILSYSIKELVDIKNGYNNIIVNSKEFIWHTDVTIIEDATEENIDKTKLTTLQVEKVAKILTLQEEAISAVIAAYENATSLLTGASPIFKLKTNLSVGEISLLFRLLKEEKVFDFKNNTELYRFIAETFSTKQADTPSDKSIKNKFLSPDTTAIKNIDALLVNMRQHLKNIQ